MASVTRTAVKPLQGGVGYQLTAGEDWAPEAVTAEWDGTSAAGNFVVAVSYYNDGGALIDRAFPEGVTNAPGDTGRTFFRPFKRGGGTSAGGGGIQFDTYPQAGGWLYVETDDDTGSPNGYGIELHDASPDGIWIHSDQWSVNLNAAGYVNLSAGFAVQIAGNQGVQISGSPYSMSVTSSITHEANPTLAGHRFTIPVGAGGHYIIRDSLGAAIFEVRGDGSIHGRAAVGAITWDL